MLVEKTLLDKLINEKLKEFTRLREEIRELVNIRRLAQESVGDEIEQISRKTNRNDL